MFSSYSLYFKLRLSQFKTYQEKVQHIVHVSGSTSISLTIRIDEIDLILHFSQVLKPILRSLYCMIDYEKCQNSFKNSKAKTVLWTDIIQLNSYIIATIHFRFCWKTTAVVTITFLNTTKLLYNNKGNKSTKIIITPVMA